MSTMQLDTPRADQPFRHEAFFYTGPDQFLDRATTFLLDGLEADEPALVMVGRTKIDDLRTALNGDADRVFFADMGVVGENPARIIPAWEGFVTSHSGSSTALRGIGEPIWPGRTTAELDECHFHESLLNVAFGAGPPFWLLCPYDTTGLDPTDIARAGHTHPLLFDGQTHRPSGAYAPSNGVGSPHDGPELTPAPSDAGHVAVDGPNSLPSLREFTQRSLAASALSRDRTSDFVLAVNELATNSIMHGGGAGTLRLWFDDTHVIAEMRDAGHITDAMVGRVTPTPAAQSGRGLWITNQLCELVQIRSAGTGTVIRVHMRRR